MQNAGKNFDLFSIPTEAGVDKVTPLEKNSPAQHQPARLRLAPVSQVSSVGKKSVTQLWLAIHLPQWSLDVLSVPVTDALPLVVVEARLQQVHACNAAAERLGIASGMALNAAYALSNQLQILVRDREREQLKLDRLAAWAGMFTPRVSIEPPDGLLLEVKGSLRLFGGARALHERVCHELQARRIHAQLSMAPTATAAMCFARQAQAELCIVRSCEELRVRLTSLPLAQLRWPLATQQLLRAMGVHTVGDCQRLPRDGLARRIGAERLNELDQLAGRAPQVRRYFVPRERFTTRCDFEMEVTQVDHLEYGLQPMLAQLEQFLRTRQAAIQSLRLTLQAHGHALPPIVVRFVALAWTQVQMWGVLKERLSRVSLTAPVLSMRLQSSALLPLHEGVQSAHLFVRATERDSQRVLRLVERLRARLGEQAVYGLSLVADHRPELAWRATQGFADRTYPLVFKRGSARAVARVSIPSTGSGRAESDNENILLAPLALNSAHPEFVEGSEGSVLHQPQSLRPLWLLTKPRALDVVQTRPHYHGPVHFEQGPERIESGWWDGRDVTRDYYIVRAASGQRLWIYRERQAPHAWFLQGLFA